MGSVHPRHRSSPSPSLTKLVGLPRRHRRLGHRSWSNSTGSSTDIVFPHQIRQPGSGARPTTSSPLPRLTKSRDRDPELAQRASLHPACLDSASMNPGFLSLPSSDPIGFDPPRRPMPSSSPAPCPCCRRDRSPTPLHGIWLLLTSASPLSPLSSIHTSLARDPVPTR